ncbi:MAG: hypothetical protein KAJ78_08140, partial [Acidobacteria bacterium]|nr:hypothetical protein [Acidobacteriota bacterium]
PNGLKQRALSVALQANARPVRRSLEDVLWGSAFLRFAWTGAVAILLTINLTLGTQALPEITDGGGEPESSWLISLGLESVLVKHGSKGPTLTEVHGLIDDLLCDGMPDCIGSIAIGEAS